MENAKETSAKTLSKNKTLRKQINGITIDEIMGNFNTSGSNDVSFLTTINSLFMCPSINNVSFFGFIVNFWQNTL